MPWEGLLEASGRAMGPSCLDDERWGWASERKLANGRAELGRELCELTPVGETFPLLLAQGTFSSCCDDEYHGAYPFDEVEEKDCA